MAAEILVPALGESVTSATIARWLKQPGEAVTADEPLVELETDKVTVEVNAPAAGTMGALEVAEGPRSRWEPCWAISRMGLVAHPPRSPIRPPPAAARPSRWPRPERRRREQAPPPGAADGGRPNTAPAASGAPKATSTEAGVHAPPMPPGPLARPRRAPVAVRRSGGTTLRGHTAGRTAPRAASCGRQDDAGARRGCRRAERPAPARTAVSPRAMC